MSSGAQVDLEWPGTDSGADRARSNADGAPIGAPLNGSAAAPYLTDEEILGIEPIDGNTPTRTTVIPSAARNLSSRFAAGDEHVQRDSSGENRPRNDNGVETAPGATHADRAAADTKTAQAEARATSAMPEWMQTAAADSRHGGEAQQLWREHQEFRAAFASPEEARAIKELLPGGVRDVLSLREATQSVERIDAALFSGDARAQSEVVAELARANPAAFRSLFAEAAKVLAGLGTGGNETGGREARNFDGSAANELTAGSALRSGSGQALRQTSEGWGAQSSEAGGLRLDAGNPDASAAQGPFAARATNHPSSAAGGLGASESSNTAVSSLQPPASNLQNFDPSAYAAFERSTNDAVARDVRGSISDTLARVLPEGVADGAARRIGDDIFQEIHSALAADRALSEQVASVLRGRRFGSAEQHQVASLLAGRARQLVPSVARRVIGEWTSSVLNTSRSKAARQAAAASRVDIAAPGGSLDSMPLRSRAVESRGLDYASMTDEQILGI